MRKLLYFLSLVSFSILLFSRDVYFCKKTVSKLHSNFLCHIAFKLYFTSPSFFHQLVSFFSLISILQKAISSTYYCISTPISVARLSLILVISPIRIPHPITSPIPILTSPIPVTKFSLKLPFLPFHPLKLALFVNGFMTGSCQPG